MMLRIIITLYASSSLQMLNLSHAQTVTKEISNRNTYHITPVRETLTARIKGTSSSVTHSSGTRSHSYNNTNSSSNRTTLTYVFNTLMRRGTNAGSNPHPSNSFGASDHFRNA